MREDYQAIVDEISALLGTPATLEGRDFALIAFGAHQSDGEGSEPALDPVRTRSILGRGSTAEVRAWFESFGITRATEPVRIDPEPSAGVVHGRICLPVRYAGVAHGYIWLIDDGAIDLSDPRLTSAMAVASRIGALLAAEARTEARTGELLRELLLGGEERTGTAEELTAQLHDALGTTGSGPLALVAVTPWQVAEGADAVGSNASVQPHVAARCVLPATGRDTAKTTSAHWLAALVRLRSADGLDPARTAAGRLLRTPGSPAAAGTIGTAGISAPRRGLAELLPAWREATAAA
ncbi:MAG TPA: PucR family transcriptional regulator, partial [Streptomyces sp.]|nr:PucR family transcriptional regulator [Streptomyces sp.]